jgi:hypothetical protein
MDIFQKLYEIENETGGDVSGIKKLIDSGQLTTATDIKPPDPKQSVQEIELFNRFNRDYPNYADGGMLVKPSEDGSRPGYAAPKTQTPVEGAPARVTFDEEKKLFRKRVQETVGGKKKSKYIYSKPGESLDSFLSRKPVRTTEVYDATVKARQFINDWTKNWFDQNLKKYGVRDFDVMIDDLSNDWNARLESGDAPKASAKFNLSTPKLKLPNVTSGRDAKMKKGAIEPFNYNGVQFYANLENNPTEIGKTLAQYKKIFYKNKIESDPRLRGELNRFFDFMAKDKTGLYRTSEGQTISKFMNTVSDDAKFLLDAKASGLDKASKKEVFNAYEDLSDNYNKFTQDKARLNAVQRETEAMAKVGEKTKEQYLKVKEAIKNQNKVLAKMSVEDIANNKQLLNSVRMVINPNTGEVSFTNYTANDPKGKPELNDLELAKKIKQKAVDGNFYVAEHISKRSLEKANTAFPNNLQSANYMSNSQLENARRFLLNPENRNTPAAQNLDKTLEQVNLTIRGSEYGGTKYGNKTNIVFDSNTNRSSIVDSQLIGSQQPVTNTKEILPLAKIGCPNKMADGGRVNFSNGEDVVGCAIRGLNKIKNTAPEKLGPIEKSNIKTFTKTASGARLLKNVLGPVALAYEALFAAPFAVYDYASGRPGEDILKNFLTLGIADQKLYENELKRKFPDYGKAQYLMDFDDRISEYERQMGGTKRQALRAKPKLNIALDKFKNDPTRLEFAETEDPAAALFENFLKSQEAVQSVAQDRANLAAERGFGESAPQLDLGDFAYGEMAKGGRAGYFDGKSVQPVEIDFASAEDKAFSDMMKAYRYYINSGGTKSLRDYMRTAVGRKRIGGGKEHFRGAGGGIAKLAGVDEGPPPEKGPDSQGLKGLLNRAMKLKE